MIEESKSTLSRVAELEARWQVKVGSPIVRAPNFVAPAHRSDGTSAILKIGSPADPEIKTEIDALRVYRGEGIATLLEADRESGVLLIERLEPGTPLAEVQSDDEATRILASVMKRLWKPLPKNHSFPSISVWAGGIRRYLTSRRMSDRHIPLRLVELAGELFNELIPTSQTPVLVHGDLHHGNVLSARREPWLAIDPNGVAAEPAYETAAMLRNPPDLFHHLELKKMLIRRIGILSEALELDAQRILRWGIAQTVLSAIWAVEDRSPAWEADVSVAEKLVEIRL